MVGGNKLSSTYKLLVALAGTVVITLFVLNQSSREPDYHQDLGEDANKIFNAIEGINNADNPLLERDHDSHQGKRTPTLNIFCFAFNRPNDFSWLWQNLMHAKPSGIRTKIVIHVDFDKDNSEGWQEQVRIASQLSGSESVHGPVTSVFATSPRGLKATMLEAWAPIRGEYAMFLEDDIDVSEMLLVYAEKFIMAYGESSQKDPTVLGYKLYNQKWDEVNQRFEEKVDNGYAPFKIQEPCSWGTVFIAEPYKRYLAWFMENYESDPMIPHAWSNTWDAKKSAKKYLQRFMWEEGLFLISINFPRDLSLTTPRVEVGTNIKADWIQYLQDRLEVPLLTRANEIAFKDDLHLHPPLSSPSSFSFSSKDLIIKDTTHRIQNAVHLPSKGEQSSVDIMHSLPENGILNPLFYSVEQVLHRLSVRTVAMFQEHFEQFPIFAMNCAIFSAYDESSLRLLLTKRHYPEQEVLPKSVVNGVNDRMTLYALAAMFLSPFGQKSLVIEVQYGLTNRLRAYASARAMALQSSRQLVVVWVSDVHCEGKFHDLFVPPSDVIVVHTAEIVDILHGLPATLVDHYNLMDKDKKDVEVDVNAKKHIYVRSAFRIFSKMPYERSDDIILRNLFQNPSTSVNVILRAYLDSLDVVTVMDEKGRQTMQTSIDKHRSFVTVHIRMLANMTQDVPKISDEDLVRMHLAAAFRVSCHFRYFVKQMSAFPPHTNFFISTDSPEAFDAINGMKEFKGRVFHIDSHNCVSRSVDCLFYAVADVILLSSSKNAFLASRWSAFSETAERVGSMKTIQACDSPPGGWNFKEGQHALSKQIVTYLESQHYANIASVQHALQKFI
eukprot:m.84673 g.84673  ORF g.84673 m.84673 type:complete len:836 (-) comp8716_c0_seq5:170-2677(-)